LFARRIAELTVESTPVKLSGAPYRLSDTQPFLWRRMITPAAKTIFNVVPCYNPFEARFADYLDRCDDIERFAALAEWFTYFHVQYLSRNGALKLYYPDFVAVQVTAQSHVHWIIETKGREFDDTDAKAAHMRRWCEEVSRESVEVWRYLKVSQTTFEDFLRGGNLRSFQALLDWHNPQGWLLSA